MVGPAGHGGLEVIFRHPEHQSVEQRAEHGSGNGREPESHSCARWSPPAKIACEVDRAGFTDVLVTGIEIRWMRARASSIATGAEPDGAGPGSAHDDHPEHGGEHDLAHQAGEERAPPGDRSPKTLASNPPPSARTRRARRRSRPARPPPRRADELRDHVPEGIAQREAAADCGPELELCASRHRSHFLAASAALARGRLCLVTGAGDPQACLREALAGFARAHAAELPIYVRRRSSDPPVVEIAADLDGALAEEELLCDAAEAERYPLGPKEYWRTRSVGCWHYGSDDHVMTEADFEEFWADGEVE